MKDLNVQFAVIIASKGLVLASTSQSTVFEKLCPVFKGNRTVFSFPERLSCSRGGVTHLSL